MHLRLVSVFKIILSCPKISNLNTENTALTIRYKFLYLASAPPALKMAFHFSSVLLL